MATEDLTSLPQIKRVFMSFCSGVEKRPGAKDNGQKKMAKHQYLFD
jgi:hypothetical protein